MDFLQALRLHNIFGPGMGGMVGNDLPSQGGITGNMYGPAIGGMGPTSSANVAPPQFSSQGPSPDIGPPLDIAVQSGLPNMSGPAPGPVSDDDFATRMQQMYHPSTAAEDRFNQLISQYPQEQPHSRLSRIGAAIFGGITGMDEGPVKGYLAGKSLLDEGRQTAIEDWKNQMGPLQQAANLERYENMNQRSLLNQSLTQDLRDRQLAEKTKTDEAKVEIAKTRAAVYKFKSEHPGMKYLFPKGGTIQAVDPITNKVIDLGIDTGTLTDEDRINLQTEGGIQKIEATGAQQRETEGVKETNRQKDIAARGEESRKTKGTPGVTAASARPETPNMTKIRQANTARQIANTNSRLAKFIKITGNDFTITPPGESIFGHTGPTAAEYDQIKNLIYGAGATAPMTSHGATPAPTGTRVTIYKNGKAVGTVPAEQAEQAKSEGYEVR